MMRRLCYIFGFLLCVSCSDFSAKSESATAPNEDAKEQGLTPTTESLTADFDRKDADFKVTDIALENIDTEIFEKLQANYEAQILAAKHPEFSEAIKEQLADSNKFAVSLADSIQTIAIEDVQLLGEMKVQNDSISTQKIHYTTLINSTYKQKI